MVKEYKINGYIVWGFIVGWVLPFIVIYRNHVFLKDGGYDIDLMGVLLVLFILGLIFKKFNKKVNLWQIHQTHRYTILFYENIKKILPAIGLTWILHTIEDDINKLQWSGVLISICFIVGFLLTILGYRKQTKKELANKG